MIPHEQPALSRYSQSRYLYLLIRSGALTLAGNKKLKIYGTLPCASGKRMHRANRVFFRDKAEALALGYRPCGHCSRTDYREWKKQQV